MFLCGWFFRCLRKFLFPQLYCLGLFFYFNSHIAFKSIVFLVVRAWNILKELYEMESDFFNGVWQGPFWFTGWFLGIFGSAWWCFYLCFRICSIRLKIYTIKLVYYEIYQVVFQIEYIYICVCVCVNFFFFFFYWDFFLV